MKLKKMTKRIMACGLAFALVVSGSGFGSSTASAAKKKKAKSKVTKVSVTVGKTKKLTMSKPKKKVTWKTSNKKVVKITKKSGKKKNKATIKGIKKGTATITAKSGKTTKKFKVTVKAVATNIKTIGVDTLDESCLVVQLKKAAAVNVSDLTIGLKEYNEGKYNYEATVKTLTTTDQITYRIYLSTRIYNGEHVKLTIGKDSKEIQYQRAVKGSESVNVLWEKEATGSESCSDYFTNTIGTVKYTLKEGTLPDGVIINNKRGIIKGIPTTVGTYPVTLQATDELGRTGTATINYIVYDKTVIVCPNSEQTVRLDDYVDARKADTATNVLGETVYDSFAVRPMGGSGSYKFTLAAPDVANVRLSTDVKDSATGQVTPVAAKSTNLIIPYEMTPGTHTYTITITDEANPQLQTTTTVTVNAENYVNVKGNAKDVNGAELSGNRLYFYPVSATSSADYVKGRRYYKDGNSYDVDNLSYTAAVGISADATAEIGVKKGTYSAELTAGEYIVKVWSAVDGIYYQMSTTLTVGADATQMLDVMAPVRFYSVSGIATYANGAPVAEQYVYFETKDEQFEDNMSFSVKTGPDGAFIASLPANNYVAYVRDEGTRKYFTAEIAVKDADMTVSDFKLTISRTVVSGTVMNGTTPMTYTDLQFINPTGDITSVTTDKDAAYKVALAGGPAPAGLTYTVKAYISGSYHAIGTVTILDTEVTKPATNFTYSFANEVKDVPEITALGSDLALTSNGTNDMYVKLVVTESGRYQIRANSDSGTISYFRLYILDSEGYNEASYSDSSSTYVSGTPYLSAGTYYIKVLPQNRTYDDEGDYVYTQVTGNFKLNVTKDTSYDDE